MTETPTITEAPPAIRRPSPAGQLTAIGSALRWPAAAAALVAAAAHLPVIPQHLSEVPYVGWLFIGLSAVCGVGAILLAVRDLPVVWIALGSTCLAAVAGYVVSRGPGLPGMSDDLGDWTNPLGIISVLTEGLVVILAVVALCSGRAIRRPGLATTVIVGAAGALTVATYLLGLATT